MASKSFIATNYVPCDGDYVETIRVHFERFGHFALEFDGHYLARVILFDTQHEREQWHRFHNPSQFPQRPEPTTKNSIKQARYRDRKAGKLKVYPPVARSKHDPVLRQLGEPGVKFFWGVDALRLTRFQTDQARAA